MAQKKDTHVLVHSGKHGDEVYATALAMVRAQLKLVDANYSWWDDETIDKARVIVAARDEAGADRLLESRSDYEYEGVEWVLVKT